MRARLSIVAGLVAGMAVAVLIVAGLLAFGPEPVPEPTPVPTFVPSSSPAVSPSGGAPVTSSPGATTAGAASEDPGTLFHIGETAPALVVPQVGGGTIDLEALRGTPVWVNFMGTYCPPCVDEFPLMNGFAARYAENDLVVVAIDIQEDEGVVAAFATELNATFPIGLDTNAAAQRAWGAFGLPVHYWIDRDGIVRDGALGGIGPDVMARGVGAILPGVEVAP
jgi:thiol-disulfide isomerase/thioredoxin